MEIDKIGEINIDNQRKDMMIYKEIEVSLSQLLNQVMILTI